MFKLGVDSQ